MSDRDDLYMVVVWYRAELAPSLGLKPNADGRVSRIITRVIETECGDGVLTIGRLAEDGTVAIGIPLASIVEWEERRRDER